MGENSWMVDDGSPEISYPFLMAFLAGAFVFQENTHPKISHAFLIEFLAGAFVLQENTS